MVRLTKKGQRTILDPERMRSIINNENEGFAVLRDYVYSIAYKKTKDANKADEITQTTIVAVIRHKNDYDSSRSRPSTWIGAILRNEILHYFAEERRQRGIIALESRRNFLDKKYRFTETTPEEIAIKKEETEERNRRAYSVLRILEETMSQCNYESWTNHEVRNLGVKKMQKCLGKSESTLKSRIFRGRKNVKKLTPMLSLV